MLCDGLLSIRADLILVKPNVKLSRPERVPKQLENDQLPVAGSSTLGAKRIRVGCSALFGCIGIQISVFRIRGKSHLFPKCV